jgi:hypothetical protein
MRKNIIQSFIFCTTSIIAYPLQATCPAGAAFTNEILSSLKSTGSASIDGKIWTVREGRDDLPGKLEIRTKQLFRDQAKPEQESTTSTGEICSYEYNVSRLQTKTIGGKKVRKLTISKSD